MEASMPRVPASEFQKNFGEWHDKVQQAPVEITKYGRPTAYLVSADMFHQLWERFRVSLPVGALSESEVDLIMQARVETDTPYNLDDLPDTEEEDVSPKLKR
jgi:prevent-host-death family protein